MSFLNSPPRLLPAAPSTISTIQPALTPSSVTITEPLYLDEKYFCSVCENVLLDPVLIVCGHRCCKGCFVSARGIACLECKYEGVTTLLKECNSDNYLRREMANFTLECHINNCEWRGPHKNFIKHINDCHTFTCNCGNQIVDALKYHSFQTRVKCAKYLKKLDDKIKELEKSIMKLKENVTRVDTEDDDEDISYATSLETKFVHELNERLSRLIKEVKHQEQVHTMMRNFEYRIHMIENQWTLCDEALKNNEGSIEALQRTTYNGIFTWSITNMAKHIHNAKHGRPCDRVLHSPIFYIGGKEGYRMKIRIYLNGKDDGEGKHISIYVVIMKGDFDALLTWPFQEPIKIIFVDQGDSKTHIHDTIIPDVRDPPYQRPVLDMNSGIGCSTFLSLETLDHPSHSYIKDDTSFIRIVVGEH